MYLAILSNLHHWEVSRYLTATVSISKKKEKSQDKLWFKKEAHVLIVNMCECITRCHHRQNGTCNHQVSIQRGIYDQLLRCNLNGIGSGHSGFHYCMECDLCTCCNSNLRNLILTQDAAPLRLSGLVYKMNKKKLNFPRKKLSVISNNRIFYDR